MREIKFRVWNKSIYPDLLESTIVSLDNTGWININKSTNGGIDQYTGLHDKNGKEIYEGDILVVRELHDGDEYAWKQPTGPAIPCEVKWDDNYKQFDFGGCSRVIYSPSHFEVIGNIYENPNLLSQDK